MPSSIQFFGAAAYKIVTASGRHVLIDPFLDKNPDSPVKTKDLDQVDFLLLTHNAFDHSKELTVTGSAAIAGEYRAVLNLMAPGRIQTKPLINKTAPLSEGQAMFDALHKGDPSLMKIVLHP